MHRTGAIVTTATTKLKLYWLQDALAKSREIVVGGGRMISHILNERVALGEEVGKQWVSSFS